MERVLGGAVRDRPDSDDENGPIGIFPNWWWLYGAVVIYTVAAIVLLHLFSVTLDFGLH